MKTKNKLSYTIILFTNIVLVMYYTYECYNFYTDNFTPDGWRFLPVFFVIDIIFLISSLLALSTKNWRFLLVIAIIALLQNTPIGFGMNLVAQTGLVFSLLISIFLICFKRISDNDSNPKAQ